jgi:CRP-like cAMP-binding protein
MNNQESIKKYKDTVDNVSAITSKSFQKLVAISKFKTVPKGYLIKKGQRCQDEIFVLTGCLRTYVESPNEKEITLDFFCSQIPLSPIKTRTEDSISRINIAAIKETELALVNREKLLNLMIENRDIYQLCIKIIETDLIRKSNKEIALASMTGNERLQFLREQFNNIENEVPHAYLASYLGMTNVSFSRQRGKQSSAKSTNGVFNNC